MNNPPTDYKERLRLIDTRYQTDIKILHDEALKELTGEGRDTVNAYIALMISPDKNKGNIRPLILAKGRYEEAIAYMSKDAQAVVERYIDIVKSANLEPGQRALLDAVASR